MNASPAMETGGPLVCFGASATLRSPAGERSVAIEDLWTGPGETTAAPTSFSSRSRSPLPPAGTGSAYLRLEYRRQMEIAVVGARPSSPSTDGTVTDARIAMTALAPTIRRVPEAEAALVGSDGGAAAIEPPALPSPLRRRPISDVRGSADYRRAMAAVIAAARDRGRRSARARGEAA